MSALLLQPQTFTVSLELLTGALRGQIWHLDGPRFLIGADPRCNLKLNHPEVNSLHCGILVDRYSVRIRDFGSILGTKLDGQLISRDCRLQDGDVISVACTLIRVNISANSSARF